MGIERREVRGEPGRLEELTDPRGRSPDVDRDAVDLESPAGRDHGPDPTGIDEGHAREVEYHGRDATGPGAIDDRLTERFPGLVIDLADARQGDRMPIRNPPGGS